jgi:stress response protein SCP2
MELTQGGNAALPAGAITVTLAFDARPAGLDIDVSAYLLGPNGKVRGDADMVFYNQPASPDGAVRLSDTAFTVDPARIDPAVDRIAICVVVDGGSAAALGAVTLSAGDLRFRHATAGQSEAAIIVAELYRRGDAWKLRAVGQGFAGGLAPLARSFGIEVADTPPAAPAAPAPVDLRKKVEQRLVSLEKAHPQLVSLAKTARVSLAKTGADARAARVWLVLDVSGSMRPLFRSGAVQRLGERALAYGLNLDDDGEIAVLLFDDNAQLFGSVNADNYRTFAADVQKAPSIWGTTSYGEAMKLLRAEARRESDFGRVPVYVIFVTDGGTENRPLAEREIKEAAAEGIFWKFMAIGQMPRTVTRTKRALPSGFDFLAYLDDMPGRVVDNADFFAVRDPDEPSDAEFFDLMAQEYAGWLDAATKAGVLKP